MDDAPHHNGPGEPLVEGDVLVQQGPHAARSALTAAAHEGDEITANGQEDQGRVEVDHEGGHSREGERLPRADPHVGELRVELEPEEVDAAESKIDEHPYGKEDVAWKIDPPTKSHHCARYGLARGRLSHKWPEVIVEEGVFPFLSKGRGQYTVSVRRSHAEDDVVVLVRPFCGPLFSPAAAAGQDRAPSL